MQSGRSIMTENDISTRLAAVRGRIAAAAEACGRPSSDVQLVAVSKFHPAESIAHALEAGQRIFGENRVQEAESKFPTLRTRWPDLRLHIIGGLQTNKALAACRIADVIESLDRPPLSDAIARAGDRLGRLPDLFVQINTGDEPQKYGVPRAEAAAFIDATKRRFGDRVRGLMCIPPEDQDPRAHFAWLARTAREAELPAISMGMSADFEAAIAEGATLVRVGTAIFGARPAIGA
ncbi:YggS family pyridoxal phosphate enzyme [Neoasaia chiangmaiensis]|uniref:Pyridoxal phosphate homeostasis protein n=2 Tax=Neoasaia chiangmaiensis TaxID=320497 RepID=A0A1U9KUV4_9PROT|nr:YggS family pyridoxal phosphate-dependent enzyme [Neoasaia chiangmaiensis]AQS89585.1 YggS family pyridoxal phosphate enzyme [Neoasaia chiangmaiensis]